MVASPSPFTPPIATPSEEGANNFATPCEGLAVFPPTPVEKAGWVMSLSIVTTLVTGTIGCTMGVGLAMDVVGIEGAAAFALALEGGGM